MKKAPFDKLRKELLTKSSDDQLRILRIQMAKELESRLAVQEKRFFKNPAIGVR